MIKNEVTIAIYQKRVVNGAIGPSTMRNQGPPGTIDVIRKYLFRLEMGRFMDVDENGFNELLDLHTEKLRKKIIGWVSKENRKPKSLYQNQYWGTARKALNVYLMLACYHRELSTYFGLRKLERYLEVPLDSYVAKGLKKATKQLRTLGHGSFKLPAWKGVKKLSRKDSDKYQSSASDYANEEPKCTRVQLDLLFWRQDQDK